MNNVLRGFNLALVIFFASGFTVFSIYAEESEIPSWIKNTAGWWANDQITDSDFIQSMGYLVQNRILIVPQSDSEVSVTSEGEATYLLPKEGETTNLPIFGTVNPKYGNTVELIIYKPDGTVEEVSPKLDKSLKYSYIIKIDETFPTGHYDIKSKMFSGDILPVKSFYVKERNDVPPWIKTNAGWWAEDQISDTDFISGIQFLVKNKIVKLDPTIQPLQETPQATVNIKNLETLLPTKPDLDKIRESVEDWETVDERQEPIFSHRVGVTDSSRIVFYNIPKSEFHNLEDYYDENTGFYSIGMVAVEIYRFDKKSNADRFLEPDFQGGLPPISTHQLTGNCFGVDVLFASYISCTKDTFSFIVTASSPNYENSDVLAGFFMDSILEEYNHSMSIKYDISVLDILEITKITEFPPLESPESFQSTDTEYESFVIDMISCEPTGSGNYIEVSYGVKNNLNEDYTLDLQFLQLDSGGNVIEVDRHYMQTKAGRTIYDSSLMDYGTGTVSCLIEIVDAYLP